jgi:hypothetical protein
MNPHLVIQSQYLASLGMLKQVIVNCPESLWDAPGNQDKFWRKSYHALFFAHLYVQRSEKDGELYERLDAHENIELAWVSSGKLKERE